MSEEQSRLRTTLLGSLLDSVRRNRSRGHERRAAVRGGAIYLDRRARDEPHADPADALPDERTHSARC
jgi:phenylalanyl-tRNA synthetase beta subunit